MYGLQGGEVRRPDKGTRWPGCCGRRASACRPPATALITTDAGGSSGHRTRARKLRLAQLAAETDLTVMVCHLPPGTSKGNEVDPSALVTRHAVHVDWDRALHPSRPGPSRRPILRKCRRRNGHGSAVRPRTDREVPAPAETTSHGSTRGYPRSRLPRLAFPDQGSATERLRVVLTVEHHPTTALATLQARFIVRSGEPNSKIKTTC